MTVGVLLDFLNFFLNLGVLVAKRFIFEKKRASDGGGGGSVFFVTKDDHSYLKVTPNILINSVTFTNI